jgi:hypothetical protein
MAKTVLTYSWLVRKAMSLFRKDKAEYMRLVSTSEGTEKMLRGVRVYWHGLSMANYQYFDIRDKASGSHQLRLYCNHRNGKAYTYYEPTFTTTGYRKRITDKYLPITLPQGVRSRHNVAGRYTPCLVHNADGSVFKESQWAGGGRNRRGSLADNTPLVICDDTGKFVGHEKFVEEQNLCAFYNDSMSIMGWFPAASTNRTEWLESIRAMPEGTCDHKKMATTAARAYLAASKMVAKYPHLRMALFPAVRVVDGEPATVLNSHRYGAESTRMTVVGRTQDGVPTLYFMPEVLVYWIEEAEAENRVVRLSMIVPPHGNPLLDPTGKAALSSRTARRSIDGRSRWNPISLPDGYEQPYHSLLAYRQDQIGDSQIIRHHGFHRFSDKFDGPCGEQDKKLVLWPKHENKVLTVVQCDQSDEVDVPLPMDIPVAMKPEDVAMRFEEKLLLASLPLC